MELLPENAGWAASKNYIQTQQFLSIPLALLSVVFMLTSEGFFLPVTGLRPGTVGLDDVVVFFVTVTVLPLNLAFEIGLDVLSLAFDALLVAVVLFVVKVLLLLLVDSSDLTSAVTSSTSLSASSWLMLEADSNSATVIEKRQE